MKLSVLGPAGTFTDAAAQVFIARHPELNIEPDYHPTFDLVYNSVVPDGLGLLPLENQLDGFVQATLQRLQVADVTEIGEVTVPVNFGLAAKVDDLAKINRIYVQFKTEGQCQNLLANLPQAEIITTSSNMTSLEKLQAGQNGDAAIIPQSQMTALDFPLMQDNVADQDDNATRFIVFKKQPASLVAPEATEAPDTAFKFPMFITPPTEQPGVLREILNHLADAGLNLVTIMSLPTRQKIGIYSFYIEVSGTFDQKETLFDTLGKMAKAYTVHPLGFYAV